MFYEKLQAIYHSSGCDRVYPESRVENLDNFIAEHLFENKRILSPYSFALKFNMDVRSTIQFFIYFSNELGVFDIKYFVDCFESNCHERIFVQREDLQETDIYVFCDECGTRYPINLVKKQIKLYFQIRPELKLPDIIISPITHDDPNSSYLALEGLPPNLKALSPSSEAICDEGDSSVPLDAALTLNSTPSGLPINQYLHDLETVLRTLKG